MIGGDGIDRTVGNAYPQTIQLLLVTQRWAEDVFRPIFTQVTLFIEQQILRAGFYPHRLALLACQT
ncbi:hypothetical protein D3C76_1805980 [compost metagenome]